MKKGTVTPFRAWRELRRLLRESQDSLERALKGGGAGSLVHLEALEYLVEQGAEPIPQSQLQEALGMSQSSTSRLVSRLERQGLVRRSHSETDARASLITLTPAGVDTTGADLHHFAPMIRNELRTITEALVPTTAPGAESLLLPRDDDTSASLLQFGETLMELSQATASAMEATAVRDSLEFQMLSDAARHWSAKDMTDCRQILTEMAKSLDQPEQFFRADWALHRRLLQISPNRLLRQIYGALLSVVENNLEHVMPTEGLDMYLRQRLEVHTELVEAVASGNPDLLRRATARHAFTAQLSNGLLEPTTT